MSEAPDFQPDEENVIYLLILLIESMISQAKILAQTSAAMSALLKAVHDRMPDIAESYQHYQVEAGTSSPTQLAIDDSIREWQRIGVRLGELLAIFQKDQSKNQ